MKLNSSTKSQTTYSLLQRRNGVFYLHHKKTNQRISLKTRDRAIAEKILEARNNTSRSRQEWLLLAKTYFAMANNLAPEMTWAEVMADYLKRKDLAASTIARMKAGWASKVFDSIRKLVVMDTSADEFRAVLEASNSSNVKHLSALQSYALKKKWLLFPVLDAFEFVTPKAREARPITFQELNRVVAVETNREYQLFYRMAYASGASQHDTANLTVENFDTVKKQLRYFRQKTKNQRRATACRLSYGQEIEELLAQLPSHGFLFPNLQKLTSSQRSSHFHYRCKLAGVTGVWLHSLRYAFICRAKLAGFTLEETKSAVGHSCDYVHRLYSASAELYCPAPPLQRGVELKLCA